MNGHEDGRGYKFDWRMAVVTFLMVAGQGAIQYGVITTTMAELERRMERVEQKIDERMMPRDEFEKRFLELEKRVEENRQRIQKIEEDRVEELQRRGR